MSDIFVSHATADDVVVTRIHDALEQAGLPVWVDHRDLNPPESNWRSAIHEALMGCRRCLLVLSRNTINRPEVDAEWTYAQSNGRELFVVIIDDVPADQINYRLHIVQWINLAKDWAAGMDYLIACLRGEPRVEGVTQGEVITLARPITGSLDPRLTSIPMSGRDADLKQVLSLLRKGPTTVLGVGGLGKSRLAAEAVLKSEDTQGAIWHRADELSRPDNILELLRLHFRLEPTASRAETLAPLRANRRLVVLDNAESIPEGDQRRAEYAKLISDLFGAGAQVLLTSRTEWPELPAAQLHHPQTLPLDAATQIVLDMAQALNTPHDLTPHAEDMARAARQHPRLIEWAVNKTRKFEPAKVIRELEALKSADIQKALDEMVRQTLRQMVEIEGAESESALRRLNVCRGGFTYEAAAALLSLTEDEDKLDSLLMALQKWPFVELQTQAGHTRYEVDPLVIAAIGEDETAYTAHYDYYLDLVREHDEAQDYVGLDIESENLVAAFERMLLLDPRAAFDLSRSSENFMLNRGRIRQYASQIDQTTALLKDSSDEALQAAIQDSLGVAYGNLAGLQDREANMRRAIAAYQAALVYRTPQNAPLDYAATQNNLGAVYRAFATLEDPAGNLRRAIAAYEAALTCCSPDTVPLKYAALQNNLGAAYRDLSAVEDQEVNLRRAIAAYEAALVYRTPQRSPLDYATTQNNLGAAYNDLATVKDRQSNLHRAIAAYEAALIYRTAQSAPLNYALTQNNLGTAYVFLASVEDLQTNLRRAISAYQAALVYQTPQTAPLHYAVTQRNLGSVYLQVNDWAGALNCWREAEKYYRQMGDTEKADLMLDWISQIEGSDAPPGG